MPSPSLRDPRLAQLYARTPGPVAFVDESYRAHGLGGERPFYAMSAVTFAPEQMDRVREVLTDIAAGRYWHTTEAFRQGQEDDIARMTDYIAGQLHWSVVTVEATITDRGGMDEARQTCLAALTREVTRGSGPGAVRLVVADLTDETSVNQADQRTVDRLRVAADIDRSVVLYHGRMGREPLLWSADVVAWASRRALAVDDPRWIAPVRPVLTMLDARTGKTLDIKQPQAAAARDLHKQVATPGAQQTTGEQARGQSAVAQTSVRPAGQDRPGGFTQGTSVLDDLVRQVRELRQRLGHRGVLDGNTPAAVARRAERAQQEPPAPQQCRPGL